MKLLIGDKKVKHIHSSKLLIAQQRLQELRAQHSNLRQQLEATESEQDKLHHTLNVEKFNHFQRVNKLCAKQGYQVDIVIWETSSQSGNYNEDVNYDMIEEFPLTEAFCSKQEILDSLQMLPALQDYLGDKIHEVFTKEATDSFDKLVNVALEVYDKFGNKVL